MQMLKLGAPCKDNASGHKGMLLLAEVFGPSHILYLFQPKLINAETKMPVKGLDVTADRIDGLETEEREIPLEVLGTEVTDTATGYSGKATKFIVFQTGCIHVEMQSSGKDAHGDIIRPLQTDIARCEGPAIKKLKPAEKIAAQKKNPGPAGAHSVKAVTAYSR